MSLVDYEHPKVRAEVTAEVFETSLENYFSYATYHWNNRIMYIYIYIYVYIVIC